MSRLAIALVAALAATAAHAQATRSEQAQPPAGANETRPFLFDGRMKGDGDRQRAPVGYQRLNGGAIVMPPKEGKPAEER